MEAGRRLAKISQEAEQDVTIAENECSESGGDTTITLERIGMVVGIAVGFGSLYVMWCDRISRNGSEVEKSEQDKPQVTEEKAADQPQDGFDLFD